MQSRAPKQSLKELAKARTPRDWTLESRAVAVDAVYLRGQLKDSTRPYNAPALPNGYAPTAKTVAERQAALAGFRLADEIQKLVK